MDPRPHPNELEIVIEILWVHVVAQSVPILRHCYFTVVPGADRLYFQNTVERTSILTELLWRAKKGRAGEGSWSAETASRPPSDTRNSTISITTFALFNGSV